jgi:sugar/nucleoside kinase (ribokinase family)
MDALAQEGVEIRSPEVVDQDTGICVAMVDASAERTFVSHMGAESVLERNVLDALNVSAHDIVYVSGYSLMLADKGAVLIDWLEQLPQGTRVAFDPGPLVGAIDTALLKRMLGVVSIWTSNRVEALRFAQTDHFDTAFDTVIARLAPGALAIVRDGARGCELRVGESLTYVPGFEVKAVDSNGAGDAHAGVFLAVLASGTDAQTAARRANAAAAIAVTRYGPATSPDAAEIDAFIASHG